MKVNLNGTTLQSSLNMAAMNPNEFVRRSGIVLCRIDEVVYPDSSVNTTGETSNRRIQYNATICEGRDQGGRVFGVLDGQTSGDGGNNKVKVRRATNKKYQGPNADKIAGSDGEYVLVAWLGNNGQVPIIIGTVSHPDHDDPDSAEGLISREEYNGIRTTIDAEGNFSIEKMGGPVNNNNEYTEESSAGAYMRISADGSISLSDGSQTFDITKDEGIAYNGLKMEIEISGTYKLEAAQVEITSQAHTVIDGSMVAVGGYGKLASGVGDFVLTSGRDSAGDTFTAIGQIVTGSSKVLLGG